MLVLFAWMLKNPSQKDRLRRSECEDWLDYRFFFDNEARNILVVSEFDAVYLIRSLNLEGRFASRDHVTYRVLEIGNKRKLRLPAMRPCPSSDLHSRK